MLCKGVWKKWDKKTNWKRRLDMFKWSRKLPTAIVLLINSIFAEAYSEPLQISSFFWINQLFSQKYPSYLFDRVLNTTLPCYLFSPSMQNHMHVKLTQIAIINACVFWYNTNYSPAPNYMGRRRKVKNTVFGQTSRPSSLFASAHWIHVW